ncbi:MAG: hypothetical protein GY873_02615 [Bosea sp.]|uniref:hypothetical protein n=1 Tax=Bosea sp. (in: a-proteobacteria) TaxID=1871050 RepID=UPI0023A547AC|nr:hypothetical protein [Bosea sp. (in: a-proteobacteria)]MCP4733062.1 hypothetical protein [Bosea sp. (in: a-proteobacteria)]
MSGPKTAKWQLADAGTPGALSFEEGCALLAEYRRKAELLAAELDALRAAEPGLAIAEVAALVPSDAPAEPGALVAQLIATQDWNNRLLAALEEARAALALALAIPRTAMDGAPALCRADEPDTAESMRMVAKRLLPGASDATVQEVRRILETADILGAGIGGSLDQELKRLKQIVSKSNAGIAELRDRRTLRQRRQGARAGQLLVAMLGIEKPEAETIRTALEAAQRGDEILTDEVVARATALVQAAQATKAATILKTALSELDYDVGEAFETCFASGGEVVLGKHDKAWSEHACRIAIDAQARTLDLSVVRFGAEREATRGEAMQDIEMETRFCRDVEALRARLAKAGIDLGLERAAMPGEVPMQRVAGSPAAAGKSSSAPRKIEAARPL